MLRRASPILLLLAMLPFLLVMGFYSRFVLTPLVWIYPRWGRPLLNETMRFWGSSVLRMGVWICGVDVRTSGYTPEPSRSFLVISNHQSIIDIVVLVWLFRVGHIKFVMKKELEWGIPNISPATRTARFAFLDRKAGGVAAEAPLRALARAVREEGTGCVIFPEGTRSRDGNLRTFKAAGTAILCHELDLDVVVVTLDGNRHAAKPAQMLANLPGLRIRVHVSEPAPLERFRADPRTAVEQVRAEMEANLAEFRSGDEPPPARASRGSTRRYSFRQCPSTHSPPSTVRW